MNILELTFLVVSGAFVAGLLGALTGLGGGVVVVPMLTILFGVDIRYAIGASLVCVIGTSSGAAAAYVKEGFTNIRIGMFLEIATTCGAIFGAFLAGITPTNVIAIIFGIMLLYSAILSFKERITSGDGDGPDCVANWLRLNGSYPAIAGEKEYHVHHVPAGFGLMIVAGTLSGLLGIGSGAAKVLAMDQIMRIPFKVSTTTSNFMIGVTAAASAGIYFSRGYIDPGLSMPVMLGVLAGSLVGAKVLVRTRTKWLRILFGLVLLALAAEMIYNGIIGKI